MRILSSWYPPSDLQAQRSSTLPARGDEPYLSERFTLAEGLYDLELWTNERHGRVSFSFFHLNEFRPPLILREFSFEHREQGVVWFQQRRHDIHFIRSLHQAAQNYCLPVIQRDRAVKALNLELGQGVRRVRAGKRYLIYFYLHEGSCDHWFAHHIHAVRLEIYNHHNRKVVEESFDCDHVWQGVQFYLRACQDFSSVIMESTL